MDEARRAAEAAARLSYGRLVALLASRSGDIASAEDALADAFASAIATWPGRGVPDNPDAWLLVAARRNLGHRRGREATAQAGEATLLLLDEERALSPPTPFHDERLKLLFVCAHPALSADVQAPLMLQTVLGLDAARIAACFLTSPAAMGQKLVRAKAKIRAAQIPFLVPGADQLAQRIAVVLDAIYAAYGTGWDDFFGSDGRIRGLAREAIWLGRVLADLMPDQPEALGLLSLMLYCDARTPARRGADGAFVPLSQQDPRLWSRQSVGEAEACLRKAARFGVPGRFQTEAAIQSLHAQSVMTGEALAVPLMRLYDLLVAVAPSKGALVARAVAYAEGGAVEQAQEQLAAIEGVQGYQPYWAALARVGWCAGDTAGARDAANQAAALSNDPAVQRFLLSGGLFSERVT